MKWLLKHAIHGDKPWAVQAEALRRSEGQERYGFHLEQGLGKSSLVFNEFLNSDCDVMLVIAPQSFKADWPMVPAEWGHPDVLPGMWPHDPVPLHYSAGRALYAANYEAIRSGGREHFDRLITTRKVFLVYDETTSVKNPRAQVSRAALDMAKPAAVVRILNGTPIVSNALDLFTPLKILGKFDRMNAFSFRNRFCIMGGFQGRQIKGVRNEEELYAVLDSATFRALKADWRKDLPPKVYSTVHLEMTERQRRHYKEMHEDFYTVVNDMDVTADMVLIQLDKSRQIASGLAMQDGRAEWIEEPGRNPKLRALLDIIDGGPTKLIAVHFYRASGDLLHETLTKAGLHPARIGGGMKPEQIIEEKRRFNEDPQCRVLVAQEAATARGHTLIGGTGNDRCNRVVFFENSFSLMERLQIEDRIHRGAQDQDCLYFDLVTSPIDQFVADTLRKKKELADSVDEVVKVVRAGH